MSTYHYIQTKKEKGLAELTFNRPEKRHAMSPEMIKEISDWLTHIQADTNIRLLVIRGDKEGFSAGGDLDSISRMDEKTAEKNSRIVQDCFHSLRELHCSSLAVVEGQAVGGGFELALAADMCIASTEARFGLPETRFSIIPGGGGTRYLCERINWHNALYYILSGKFFSAEEALRQGIVQAVIPPQNLAEEVAHFCDRILNMPPEVSESLKELLRSHSEAGLQESLSSEARLFGKLVAKYGKAEIKSFLKQKK